MIFFDVDEMFDCKTGSIAVKTQMIICGSGSDEKVKAFRHNEIINLFGNVQPIISNKVLLYVLHHFLKYFQSYKKEIKFINFY